MNKTEYLSLNGISFALSGFTLLLSKVIGITASKILFTLLLFTGGVLAVLFSRVNKQNSTTAIFQLIQGIGTIIFSFLVLFFPKSLEGFLIYISYFIMVFGIIDVLFSFSILNAGLKIDHKIFISRLIASLLWFLWGGLLLGTSLINELSGLTIAGILMILGGLFIILFSIKINSSSNAV